MEIGEYISQHGLDFQTHEHLPAFTAQEVAAEEHISGNLLAKAVLVHDGRGYAMCVLAASCKLDMKKAAKARKARQIRLADESEMAKVFPDVEVGAEPPFGNLYDMPTLVDERLADNEEVFFQAGTHRRTIQMKFADYVSLVQPTVMDLAVQL